MNFACFFSSSLTDELAAITFSASSFDSTKAICLQLFLRPETPEREGVPGQSGAQTLQDPGCFDLPFGPLTSLLSIFIKNLPPPSIFLLDKVKWVILYKIFLHSV
jgi:hypothetical protein